MDAMPDSLLLAYLQASDEYNPKDLTNDERSNSALSLASTVEVLDSPRDAPSLTIKAFCVINGLFLTIELPTTNDNGWIYRNDLGGQSHHRWDYKKSLILLSRHTTCKKAVQPQQPCRNCMMKEIWRRECTEPENAFFLCSMVTADDLTAAINEIMIDCTPATAEQIAIYSKNIPKMSVTRKRPFDEHTKHKQLSKLSQQIQSRRRAEMNRTNVSVSNLHVDEDFYDLVGDALGLDRSDSIDSELAVLPSPLPETQPTLETPSDDLYMAYESLMTAFVKQRSSLVTMTSDVVAKLQHEFPRIYRTDAAMEQSTVLTDVLAMLSIKPSLLMMKSIFPIWMSRLRTCCAVGPTQIGLGIYNAPSAAIFQDICSSAAITNFIASGHHRIDSPTIVTTSRAMLVIYIVDTNNSLTTGNDILPLSSLA